MNIGQETMLSLAEASKVLPTFRGGRVHVSTLWRWCRKGCKGVRLEYGRLGARIVTSQEALARFMQALATLDEQPLSASAPARRLRRTDAQRTTDVREADATLQREGF
jgi:hypothetical protein